ncbi:hypothetical protein ID866_3237 [Astraeus odoratus]|nr:hypothetical protein ID866_3237 [Astraeus odoratus]
MLKIATSRCLRPNGLHLRAFHTRHASQGVRLNWTRIALFTSTATSVAALAVWCVQSNVVHNDTAVSAPPSTSTPEAVPRDSNVNSTGVDENGSIQAIVWGSNRLNILDPNAPGVEVVQHPTNVKWLENVALRDLVLHERHAACVDARGDVYQWGDGFFGSTPTSDAEAKSPKATLRGKDIVKLQLTESRVYALSSSGKVYVFAANEEQQKRRSESTDSSWWGLCSLLGVSQSTIDFVELSPKEKLKWREYFTTIAAGRGHLLALTSAGRTFSHPVDRDANSHGQLGLRKVDLPAVPHDASPASATVARVTVDLIPKSIADPYAKASSHSRTALSSGTSQHLNMIHDKDIRFSDSLFEIPALRGVKVKQITAGSRSSYVNTDEGRVLSWGANEFGQLGLGSGITLDTITVPTEVILTRNVPVSVRTKCLGISAGGDMAFFVADRTGSDLPRYVDILSCGNGQWGGLGTNLYTTAQANPVRVRSVSGLVEYDEKSRGLAPIVPEAISVSPVGHVLFTLDTLSRAGPGASGRDLMVCGLNCDYQLGTGKRKSLPVPTVLESLGGRFLLSRKIACVKDMAGKVWKNAEVEQCAVAGYGNTFVYWRIRS